MEDYILLFNKLYHEVVIRENTRLSDDCNIELRKYHEMLICDVDNEAPEYYYQISKDEGGYYTAFRIGRGHYLIYRPSFPVLAAAALFIYILRTKTFQNRRLDSEKLTIERVRQVIAANDIASARQIMTDSVGVENISFDKPDYDKISVIPISDNKIDIYYHNHTILFGSDFNKPDISRGYYFALQCCFDLFYVRKILSHIVKIFPEIQDPEKSELEYLFLTGTTEV